jgi:hypothetical protein
LGGAFGLGILSPPLFVWVVPKPARLLVLSLVISLVAVLYFKRKSRSISIDQSAQSGCNFLVVAFLAGVVTDIVVLVVYFFGFFEG